MMDLSSSERDGIILECIDAILITEKRPTLMLKLIDENKNFGFASFFNLVRQKSKQLTAQKDSKLRRLFRLMFGEEPGHAYVKKYKNKFIGEKFIGFDVIESSYSNGEIYDKVKELRPLTPILSDEWLKDGQINKARKPKAIGLKKSLQPASLEVNHAGNHLGQSLVDSSFSADWNWQPGEMNECERLTWQIPLSSYEIDLVRVNNSDLTLEYQCNLHDFMAQEDIEKFLK